jgi:hypothetical protein
MSNAKITYRQLIAYAAGELPAEEAAQVQAYLAANPSAAEPVALYRQARAALQNDQGADPPVDVVAKAKRIFAAARSDPAPGWLARLEQFIGELVFDSRAEPALAGYRGAATTFQLSFECEVASVDLEAEPLVDGNTVGADESQWRIMGQVDLRQPDALVELALVEQGAGAKVADAVADEHGMFTLEVKAGRYDLLLRVGDKVVVLRNIEIE